MNWGTYLLKCLFTGDSPEFLGEIGEWKLERMLGKLPDTYRVIRDFYLPTPDGATTQVDAAVVSEFGVFVIEAKNYDGEGKNGCWIFGDSQSKNWRVTLKGGRSFSFQNPLHQNHRHIAVLSELTGIPQDRIHNVVVFVGWAEFKTSMPEGVVYGQKLIPYITRFQTPLIKRRQVDEIAEVISRWTSTVSERQRRSHVDNLRARHSPRPMTDQPACPLCGSTMILRRRKSDGAAFFGCAQYPKCRGIINAYSQSGGSPFTMRG